jgi:hypothetical protein
MFSTLLNCLLGRANMIAFYFRDKKINVFCASNVNSRKPNQGDVDLVGLAEVQDSVSCEKCLQKMSRILAYSSSPLALSCLNCQRCPSYLAAAAAAAAFLLLLLLPVCYLVVSPV